MKILDFNSEQIQVQKSKKLYLFDTSVFARIEEIASVCKIDFIDIFLKLTGEHYYVINYVLEELDRGPRLIDFSQLHDHLLNSEYSGDTNWKEWRIPIEVNGQLMIHEVNKISHADFAQIILCIKHPELTLVSNDEKLLKSAARVIPGRAFGLPVLLQCLCEKYPLNKGLCRILETANDLYEFKVLGTKRTAN